MEQRLPAPARVVILCLALVAFATGCDPASAPPVRAAQPKVAPVVSTARAEARPLQRTIRASGTAFGIEDATVAAEVAGRVLEVVRDVGDTARPGEELLRIDPVDHELARDERARAHRQTLARLGLTESPRDELDVDSLPAVERARLQAANARARFERSRKLAGVGEPLVSEQELADLETAAAVAESNVRVERLAARALLAEARTLEAQIAIARRRVENARVKAPAPRARTTLLYEVAERFASVGEYVTPGKALFRLVASDPIEVRLAVPERWLGAANVGQRALVRIEALDRPVEGRVVRVAPTVEVETRTFRVDVAVANGERRVRAGCFATVEIEVAEERAIVVPEAAVSAFAGVVRVFAVEDGKVQDRRVHLGERARGVVEVRSGVAEGEVVVLAPPPTLRAGDAVEVR